MADLEVQGLNIILIIINVYGPYLERRGFWEALVDSRVLTFLSVVLCNDLNFTKFISEVWRCNPRKDQLGKISIENPSRKGQIVFLCSKNWCPKTLS